VNKEAFKIDVKNLESCGKEVKIQVPGKEVSSAFEKTVSMFRQHVNVPGFRLGKAPKGLLLKKYGKEVEDQVRQDIFKAAMQTLLEDEANTPITQPEIEQSDIKVSQDFSITLKYDVLPKFELPNYKSLKLESPEFKADDSLVELELSQVCERYTRLELVDRAAEEEDFVKGSFKGTLTEDIELPESAKGMLEGTDRWVPLKERTLLPGALANIAGKKAGEEVSWTCTFDDDYSIESLRGKEVTYTLTISEVHGRVVPELNDELAKQAGAESVEGLKKKILDAMEGKFKMEQLNINKEKALELVLADFDCEMPAKALEAEVKRTLHSLKHEKQITHDCEADHIHSDDCNHSNEETAQEKELLAEAQEKASKELKTRFLLGRIAKVEEVKVEDYEVQYQIYMMAQQYNVDPKLFSEQLVNNGSINEFREQILLDKALGKIVELNTTDKK
jgi:trigger factor